ncbi:MAG TPA: hypothetical protein VFX98_00800, partial [Longimicrobiaceae bacterium]|nr:hypothetical protein [Longimicrobiaceae bacterium]
HGQLSHGSRYFDLRPRRSGGGTVYICHGEIQGPPLAEVLDDVKRFMQEENGELVILKFSHFDGFDDQGYAELAEQVTGALRDWLYPGGARLAEVPLGDLLGGKGVVYVVMDTTYYAENRTPGIYVYRDSTKCNVKKGDLRVLDLYSNTTSYPEMEQQQLQLFADFDGICHPDEDPAKACDQGETCDLFLLSWTLTPVSGVWLWAQDADRNLAAGVQKTANPNGHGRRINVVFLDYVQYARPVDVCLCLNGLA